MSYYKGQSGHEMIENSLLFGVERYERKAGVLCDKIDVFCGIDPKVSRKKRENKKLGLGVLQTMSGWKVPLPPAAQYGTALKNLSQHGYIERKAKKGFKLTKRGKKAVKKTARWFD